MKNFIQELLRPFAQPKVLPWRVCAVLIVVIHLISGAFLLRLDLNNAPELYFPEDAPATVLDRELRREFPNDEILIALFSGNALYSAPFLTALDRVGERLGALPDVDRILSITTVDHIAGSADGFVVERLIDTDALDSSTPEERLERVLRDRFMPGWLATRDGQTVALVARAHKLGESRQRLAIEAALHEAVRAEGLEKELVAVAGTVALDAAQLRSMVHDSLVFTPIVMGLGLALMYWIVGRIKPVVIGAVAMSTVVVSSVALVGAIGQPYTLVTAMIPTLLSAYTVANVLHLYASLQRMRDARFRRAKRVPFALQAVHTPGLLTGLTTCAAMLSLVLVPIPPIQVFGVVAAFGVLMIYFTVFYLLPGLLWKFDRGRWPKGRSGFGWAKRFAYSLAIFSMRRAGWVAAAVGMAVLLTIPMLLKVEAESDLLKFFNQSHPLTQSTRMIEDRLVGVTALEIVVDGPGRDAFQDAERLKVVKSVQNWVDTLPEVDRSISMADIVEEMHWAFNEEDERYRVVPDDTDLLSQLLLVYDGVDLQELVNSEYDRTRILLNLNAHGANAIQSVIDRIEAHVAALDAPDLQWQIAGYGRLFADQEDLLVVGQLRSFVGAFGQVFLIMLVLWRSFPTAVISMLPNIAPLYFVFVLMGAAGIYLDMATVLIASVLLGITVDDTMHIFHNYSERRRKGRSVVYSVARSMKVAGRAVVATSILLIAQFLVLVASGFQPTANFGLLAAVGLLAAQLMDLVLLPALLVLWNKLNTRYRLMSV